MKERLLNTQDYNRWMLRVIEDIQFHNEDTRALLVKLVNHNRIVIKGLHDRIKYLEDKYSESVHSK